MSAFPPRLFLPARLLERDAPPPVAAHYFSLKEVTGTESSVAELVHLLSTMRRSEVIRWTSTLLEVVSRADGITPRQQLRLVRELIPPDIAHKMREKQTEDGWAVFHRRQLWLLLQLAVVVCKEDTPPPSDTTDFAHAIGRLCLMASEFLHEIEQVHIPEPGPPEDALKWLVMILVTHVEIANDQDVLARAYSLWFESLCDPKVKAEFDRLQVGKDFDEVLMRHLGVSLTEFFFIAILFYCQFLEPVTSEPIRPALIDSTTPSSGIYSEDDKQRTLAKLSISADALAAHLLGTPRQSWATDFSPLLFHPLIEVFPGRFACPDLSYFRQYFMDGVFWLLDSAIGKPWRSFFGTMYAWYINQLIRCFASDSDILVRRFFYPTKFQGTTDEVCDGLLKFDRLALLCEYKSSRFTTRQKAGVRMEETISAIEDSIGAKGKGVGQLAASLNRIFRGETVHCGRHTIDVSSCECVIPVVVWYEESGGNHATRLYLEEIFNSLLNVPEDVRHRIGPLLLLTTHDVEVLERFANIQPAEELLRDYATFVRNNPRDPHGTFRTYAYRKFGDQSVEQAFIPTKFAKLFEFVSNEFRKREADHACHLIDPPPPSR